MNTAHDFAQTMKGFAGAFPVDAKTAADAFKAHAAFGEKMSALMLQAAERSADISGKWTKETLARISDMAKLREDPAECARAVADFATASAETATENLAAYADVAKTAQLEGVELVISAGRDVQESAAATLRKATDEAAKTAAKRG